MLLTTRGVKNTVTYHAHHGRQLSRFGVELVVSSHWQLQLKNPTNHEVVLRKITQPIKLKEGTEV